MRAAEVCIVQATFSRATVRPDVFAERFVTELLTIDPSIRTLFSADPIAQVNTMIGTLAHMVANLHDPRRVLPSLRSLAQRHVTIGVEQRHYAIFGEALLRTMTTLLGPDFTPAARQAWIAVYELIAHEMLASAEQMHQFLEMQHE